MEGRSCKCKENMSCSTGASVLALTCYTISTESAMKEVAQQFPCVSDSSLLQRTQVYSCKELTLIFYLSDPRMFRFFTNFLLCQVFYLKVLVSCSVPLQSVLLRRLFRHQ